MTFPRKLQVAEVHLLNRPLYSKLDIDHTLVQENNKDFLTVEELSKDLSLSFDNNVQRTATMSRSISKFTEVKFEPPISSATLKVTVRSVYTKINNGFAEIRVYEKTAGKPSGF